MKARILTTLLLAPATLTTQMTTSLPGAALDLAPPAQRMDVSIHTGRIAFASDRGENWDVYTRNADGSQPTNLSHYPLDGGYAWPSTDVKPSWSPDGRRIAFASERHVDFQVDWDGNRDIYVMNADGSGLVRLTEHPAHDDFPASSSDGQHIAFCSERDGNWEIYVMNADGSDQVNVSNHPQSDFPPSWQPQVS